MRTIVLSALACAAALAVAQAAAVKPGDVKNVDGAVEQSLTGAPGDPANGKKWFVDRKLGNCLACHANADASEELFHGEVGPPLDGVADRYSEAELRGIVTNAKTMFENTIMPAFYRDTGLNRVAEDFQGKTILTAEQVEDIVAYLKTLKE